MSGSRFADGSQLPDYQPGGSLHRPGDRRLAVKEGATLDLNRLPDAEDAGRYVYYSGRVHVTQTTDAEALADLWGALEDHEPVTSALLWRFVDFIRDNFGDDVVEKLRARSKARYDGLEASAPVIEPLTPAPTAYAYGHTGV